jgi:hypothetical protein
MNNISRNLLLQFETKRLVIRCPQPGDGRVVELDSAWSLKR